MSADLKKAARSKRSEYLPDVSEDHLPPHSIEAEQGVLSCAFLAPENVLSECEEAGVKAAWFYDLRHQLIWAAMAALYAEGKPVDVISVQQWLKDRQELDSVGGLSYLAPLPDKVGSAHNIAHYLGVIKEKWMRRRILHGATESAAMALDEERPIEEVIAETERNALSLSEESTGRAEVHIKALIMENVDRLEDYSRGHAQIVGLTTGLPYLDKITGGLGGENGNYIGLFARPGLGKTSLGLDLLNHAALQHPWYAPVTLEALAKAVGDTVVSAALAGGEALPEPYVLGRDKSVAFERHTGIPAAFFSLEMTGLRLVRRQLFQHSGSDLQRFRTGYANKEDFTRLARSAKALAGADLWIDDTSRLTVEMFKARCRRMVRQYGIKMLALDYLQLMPYARAKHQRPDRVAELEEISGEIRALSKDLNVPFFILGQLNRDVEKGDRWRAPKASDIKNCGAIEQDADVIMLLYKPKLNDSEEEAWEEQTRAVAAAAGESGDWSRRYRRINCLVDKNRDGMTGDTALVFDGSCTHFHDYYAWLKAHGLKAVAAGEPKPREQGDDLSDVEEGYPPA